MADAGRRALARHGLLLSWWAARVPDRPAVVAPAGVRSFAELDANANRLARALRRLGLAPGDGLALLCGNSPTFVETVYAAQRSGLRLTPVNWHLTAGEVAYIVADCGARALVVDGLRAEVGLAAASTMDRPVPVLVAADPGAPSPVDSPATAGRPVPVLDYGAAVAAEDGGEIPDPVLGGTMLYTSGTTGRPKGVRRPPVAATALTGLDLYGYRDDGADVHLCTGPLYHAAPLAFSLGAPLANGVGVVLMDRFDAAEALALVAAHGVTHTHMVPTMFHRLLSLPEEVRAAADTSSLRFVLHGAAPCPVHVKRRLIEWLGPVVYEYYAATEGVGTMVDSATWLAHPGTVGRPLVPGQVMVADEEGRPLPAGETGLVYLHAPGTARFEYHGDPGKTASAFVGDYFTLGDVGHLDEEGYLYLTDRSADLVISGGVNIYPAEADAVLLEHPAVADAACVGVPDAEWGEVLVAVVEPRPGSRPSPDELVAFCRQRLAHYKCPRRAVLVDTLPRQDNGKVYRRRIRQWLAGPDRPGEG